MQSVTKQQSLMKRYNTLMLKPGLCQIKNTTNCKGRSPEKILLFLWILSKLPSPRHIGIRFEVNFYNVLETSIYCNHQLRGVNDKLEEL